MEYDYNVECEQNPYRMDDTVFIWGIKSSDDISGSPACMYTMNDIDLTYNERTQRYSLSIETIYQFEPRTAEFDYYKRLLISFTKWMLKKGYNRYENVEAHHVFPNGNCTFATVPQAYAWFKLMVESYLKHYGVSI